jgi:hypothetical protein
MIFDHIINWTLKSGSHDFPGSDGGTCINEAAIVAMGFKYKSVKSASDCPPCFSRPIAALAINLNDGMPDNLRNELLMPFVTRLGGTADTPKVERARTEFIIIEIGKRMIAPALDALGDNAGAANFRSAKTLGDVRVAARALDLDLDLDLDLARALDLALALDLAYAIASAIALARALASANSHRELWTAGASILDEAILMGAHSNEADVAVVACRMNAAMELAKA